MTEGPSPSATERIAASFKRLATSTANLQKVSDEFTKPVEQIEQALRQLNVGVEAWERFRGTDEDGRGNYWGEYIGFTRVHGHWRVAIHKVEGNHNDGEPTLDETWPFDDAPRGLRIGAADKLPDLVEKLVAMADKTARKLESKIGENQALAKAVAKAAAEMKSEKRGAQS